MSQFRDINVVAIMGSKEAGESLSESCGGLNGHRVEVHVGPLQGVTPDEDFLKDLDMLLLEIDPSDAQQLEILDNIIHRRFPDIPVVVTAFDATTQDVRSLMRSGAVDVIPMPVSSSELQGVISHVVKADAQPHHSRQSKGKVISFLKGGGGVGATTIAVQAGCLMASDDEHKVSRVCLIDMDVQFGTVALYLDLDSEVGLEDMVEAGHRLDGPMFRDIARRHDSGLDVIASPSGMMPLDFVSPQFADTCLDIARQEYDFVLIDMPNAWTEWTKTTLARSDLIILVTQLSVAGIRQAKHQLEALEASDLKNVPVRVVLNRFEKKWEQSIGLNEAQSALGHELDSRITNDYQVVNEALNQGQAIGKIKKRSKVEKSIRRLVNETVDQLTQEIGQQRVDPET